MEQSIYKNELIGGEFNLRKIGDENLRINNIQAKQRNVLTMAHLKKELMDGLLGLENITILEPE